MLRNDPSCGHQATKNGFFAAAFFLMGGEDEAAETAETEVAEPAGLVPLDPFIVNLAAPDDARFVKVHLQLTVVPAESAEAILADVLAPNAVAAE